MKAGIEILDSHLCLDDKTKEDEVLSSALGENLVPLVSNGKYRSYRVGSPQRVIDHLFHLSLYFEEANLKSIHMTPVGVGPTSWSDASADKLKELKEFNDRWLRETLGVSSGTTFSWGCIESTYDEKSWSSEIIYRFS